MLESLILKRRYNLHDSPEVWTAARRTERRTKEKVPQAPAVRIQNYLDRFSGIIERQDPRDRQRGIEAIKRLLLGRFVTKFENLSDGFWELNNRILRERGLWADYGEGERNERIKKTAESQLKDQESSLEEWIDFFVSPDSSELPDYFKYWAFRSITGLKKYDKEAKVFPPRSKGTADRFPEVNREALKYLAETFSAYQKGLSANSWFFDEYNLTQDQKKVLQQLLNQENFAKLYGFVHELIQPIPEHLLEITEGEWVRYGFRSDPLPLVQSIRRWGTGWCTAGENNAREELGEGDFYCYYTEDEEGKPSVPRLAIRMKGKHIYEVRGIAPRQNIDPYMSDVLRKKLDEFADGEFFLKKESDMSRLGVIEGKVKEDKDLTREELIFLYEIDGPIEGFGVNKDPRIKDLLGRRNAEQDLSIIFEDIRDYIARSIEETNARTKVYVGPLVPDIFNVLPSEVEHIYTSFPQDRILRRQVEVGAKGTEMLRIELSSNGIGFRSEALYLLDRLTPLKSPEAVDVVWLSVADLGFKDHATIHELFERFRELGLGLCPAETGVSLRLACMDQPEDDWYYVAMSPLVDSKGIPSIFKIANYGEGLLLESTPVNNMRLGDSDTKFALRFRPRKVRIPIFELDERVALTS